MARTRRLGGRWATALALLGAVLSIVGAAPRGAAQGATVPGAPAYVSAYPGQADVSAFWPAASAPAGAAVDMYLVVAFSTRNGLPAPPAAAKVVCGTCLSAGLVLSGTGPHVVAVAAHNSAGWGPPRVSGEVIVGGPPAPVIDSAVVDEDSIEIRWTPRVPPSGDTQFAVLLFDENGFSGHLVVTDSQGRSATITGLRARRTYVVAVLAGTGGLWGPPVLVGPFSPPVA